MLDLTGGFVVGCLRVESWKLIFELGLCDNSNIPTENSVVDVVDRHFCLASSRHPIYSE
jgi:hypothetical protein